MKILKTLTLTALLIAYCAQSAASLIVTPTRVTFESRDRVKEVILINPSDVTRQYKLEWVEQKRDENNGYSVLSDAQAQNFAIASPYIRFSPRRVTLQPGESQKVKLLARRRSEMTMPEYRSHLKFTALPPSLTESNDDESSGMQLKLNLLLSYTIPVVLRTVKTNVSVDIDKISFTPPSAENETPQALVFLTREGDSSAYGNLTLFHRENSNAPYEPVGYSNGLNIFHEEKNSQRAIAWTEKPYSVGGELKVVYQGVEEMKGAFYAEKVLAFF
ncbi:MAG: fimbrial chaperone protein [Arenicella sp.]|jgi:fimbrial chaperone protein